METGTLLPDRHSSDSPKRSRAFQDQSGSAQGAEDGVRILTHARYRSFIRQWYEEPAQQSVGEVTNTVRWRPSATCASPTTGEDTVNYRLDWLEQTGWRLIDHEWRRGFNCDRVLSHSIVHYRNGVFCATIDTDVFFDKNRVEGLPGGSTRWVWEARKFGGCSALLSYHRNQDVTRID
jgi:hypothetical protein